MPLASTVPAHRKSDPPTSDKSRGTGYSSRSTTGDFSRMSQTRSYAASVVLLVVAALAAAGLSAGCRSSSSQSVVESNPPLSSPVPPQMCNLGVDPSSLSNAEGALLLSGELPAIQPPCGIAIARVECHGSNAQRPLGIEPIAPERAAFWNQLVADLPGVREVLVLRTLGMDPRGIAVNDLLRAARNQDCTYLLIYRIADDANNSAVVQAVLWSLEPERAVVAFNTSIELPASVIEKCSDSDYRHLRECDASYQVEAELRQLVRDTLWDMAAKSRTGDGPTSRPNPWKSDQPILPRDDSRYRRYFMRSGT